MEAFLLFELTSLFLLSFQILCIQTHWIDDLLAIMKPAPVTVAESRPEIPTTFKDIKNTNAKADDEFRVYSEEASVPRVVEHYRDMRRYQTVEFYRRMEQKYDFTNGNYRKLMSIDEAFAELEHYVVGICEQCAFG